MKRPSTIFLSIIVFSACVLAAPVGDAANRESSRRGNPLSAKADIKEKAIQLTGLPGKSQDRIGQQLRLAGYGARPFRSKNFPSPIADGVDDRHAFYPAETAPLITEAAKLIPSGGKDDHFGYSVAVSGDTVVVGAYGDGDMGFNAGAAYIFYRDAGGPDNWGQVKKITANDGEMWDHFGSSVAISGDTVVVGAFENDDQGAAYIFYRDAGGLDNWGQVKKVTASDGAEGDNFGHAVAIDGDTIAVGSHKDDDKGSVYIFYKDEGTPDNWGQLKKITSSDGQNLDQFGYSVTMGGGRLAVGSPNREAAYIFYRNEGGTDHWGEVKKITGSDCLGACGFGWSISISAETLVVGAVKWSSAIGAAYVFYQSEGGTDNWGEVRKITASDAVINDCFGWSVSITGGTIAVGANGYWNFATGYAYIFYRDEGGTDIWGEVLKITPGDGADRDEFGGSVAISGDTLIVGAHLNDENETDAGSAYVYYRDEGDLDNWGQVKNIIGRGGAAGDAFGHSVSISDDTVVVGAQLDEMGAFTDAGSSYIYYRDESNADEWIKAEKIEYPYHANDGYFGGSVSISGDIMVAGAKGYLLDDGGAYIFYRDQGGVDNWGQVKLVRPGEGFGDDNFGCAVSISGDALVVGAYRDNYNGASAGSAYVFHRDQDGADNWGRVKLIRPIGGDAYDYFGYAVAIGGDTAVVGAYMDDENGTYSGSAYIFDRNQGGADNWGQVKKILPSDVGAYDNFGKSVSISGDTVVVGSLYDDDNGTDAGAAYIFYRDQGGVDNWGEVQKITAGDGAEYDIFGVSVFLDGDSLAVGAIGDDDNGSHSGSAYLLERDEGGIDNWGEVQKITPSDGSASGDFGRAVSIGDGTLVVGADGDDANGTDSGSAYIFSALPCIDPPVIDAIVFDSCISERCTSAIAVDAADPCGGVLTYAWVELNGPGGLLSSNAGAEVVFDPPNTGPHPCPYQVRVTATSDVSGLSASETIDIQVKNGGDVTGDGWVNLSDLNEIRDHFMQHGDPGWIDADLNCDGWVNLSDLNLVRDNFMSSGGCTCPP